jgi:hypothetical protein
MLGAAAFSLRLRLLAAWSYVAGGAAAQRPAAAAAAAAEPPV